MSLLIEANPHILPSWRDADLLKAIAKLAIINSLPLKVEITESPPPFLAGETRLFIRHIGQTRLTGKLLSI